MNFEEMLITDPLKLRAYDAIHRVWQGIPSVEVTRGGKIFVTFYSGGNNEMLGNYVLLLRSSDGGKTFSAPIAAVELAGHRCFDPCLFVDPLSRLWLTWAIGPDHGAYAAICDDPDADVLRWGKPFLIGHDVMMNKPIVTRAGAWLFPVAVWRAGVHGTDPIFNSTEPEAGAFVYETRDNGVSFTRLGGIAIPERSFDEHMLLEERDDTLAMYIRTSYGIGVARSRDGGKTWEDGGDSGLGGPCSRFHIRRLRSGRLLLVNHVRFTGRNNLALLLSEDEGRTWCAELILDARNKVSYPDVAEAADGSLYVVHDRERGDHRKTLAEAQQCAREILLSHITEEDILAGRIVSEGGFLSRVVSKLGAYEGPDYFS